MKGSTCCRRFCWLQVNFSYGHEGAASQVPTYDCSWPPKAVIPTAEGSSGACWLALSSCPGREQFRDAVPHLLAVERGLHMDKNLLAVERDLHMDKSVVWRIHVLTAAGEVRLVLIDAESGRIR